MRVELQYQPCHLLRGQEKGKYNHSCDQTHTRTHTHPNLQSPPFTLEKKNTDTCTYMSAMFLLAIILVVLELKITSASLVSAIKMNEKLL